MSQTPSPAASRQAAPRSSGAATRHPAGAQDREDDPSMPTVAERLADGPGQLLPAAPALGAATTDTLRRLTALLKGLTPIDSGSLEKLRELCWQLHHNQSAIDAAAQGPNAGQDYGFASAAIAFVERLQRALEGRQPALALQQLDDVQAICLGLCAFASVKAASPFVANADVTKRACHALDRISASLLAVIHKHGIDNLEYGQALAVHNWVSRACKARLLQQSSLCWAQVQSFSSGVFDKFSDRATAAYRGSGMTMALDEHDLGKTAAELKAMLDHGLVSFNGKEEELARVAAWLSSKAAFEVLLAVPAGVGLANLFSLFKSLLDLSTRGDAEGAEQGKSHVLALLWSQMIATMSDVSAQRLLFDEGRFLASCANLLRALYESGLPKTWCGDQLLAFAEAGRRLLNILGSADSADLQTLSLHTLANLASFIKAWHRHEKAAGQQLVSDIRGNAGAADKAHRQPALSPQILNPIKLAAKQLGTVLSPDRLATLETPATVGGLLKGLLYLRTQNLLDATVAHPLLHSLAQAAAATTSWEYAHAVGVVKSLMVLFRLGVFTWDELQPAFLALMGPPPDDLIWQKGEVEAFMRGEIEKRQTLSLPIDRYLKRDAAARVRTERTHVVGDHPLPVSAKSSDPRQSVPEPIPFTRLAPSVPRYAKPDADGFIVSSRIAKAGATPAHPRPSPALLGSEQEVEDEQHPATSTPANVDAAARNAVATAQRTSKKPLASVAPPRSRKRRKNTATAKATSADDFGDVTQLTALAGRRQYGLWLPPANTSPRQHAIARKLFTAIENNNEKKALALLAESDCEQLAGYRAESMDTLLSFVIQCSMPALALAIVDTQTGRKHAAQANRMGVNPLLMAVGLGDITLIDALLRIDDVVRNVDHKGDDGFDAVGVAIVLGRAAVLERLMQINAVWEQLPQTLYSSGYGVVNAAFFFDKIEVVKVLVTHPELARKVATEPAAGVVVAMRGGRIGMTLAQVAAHDRKLDALAVLTKLDQVRKHEAAIVQPFNLVSAALHACAREELKHVLGYAELRPLAGLRTASGCTPLMLAVWANDANLFTELLALPAVRATVMSGPGARVAAHMQWPPTLPPISLRYRDVLELAIHRGSQEMVEALLGVQEVLDVVDQRGDYTQNLLLQCIRQRMPNPVRALLQRPFAARIARIADSAGMTALHYAAQLGQAEVVEILLRVLPASEIARPNREGKSAASLAKEAGHEKTADILAAAAAEAAAPAEQ